MAALRAMLVLPAGCAAAYVPGTWLTIELTSPNPNQ